MPPLEDLPQVPPAGPWRTPRWSFLAAVVVSLVAWPPASVLTYLLAPVVFPLALVAHLVLAWRGAYPTPGAGLATAARRAATGHLAGGIVLLVLAPILRTAARPSGIGAVVPALLLLVALDL